LNTLKMSNSALDTPDTDSIHLPSSKVRICAPDKYYGERNKLKAWLLQMDRHFHVEGDRIIEDDKVMIASTYMKDQAELWVTPHLERYLDNSITDNENALLMENWDVFKTKLKQAFSPIKASVIAEKKIQTLKQTHSVADYTALFQQYQAQIEWDDAALIRMYKQGLKGQVREELMRTNARTDSLDELINEAIRLDNDLYELQIEARAYRPEYVPKKGKQPHYGRSRHGQGTYRPQSHGKARMPGVYGLGRYENMDVDNVERGKPRNSSAAKYHGKGKPDNGKETRTCYNCNKPGHLSAACRQPRKNTVTRHVNMIEPEGLDEAEDWEVVYNDEEPLIVHSPTLDTPKWKPLENAVGPYDSEQTRQITQEIQEQFTKDGTIPTVEEQKEILQEHINEYIREKEITRVPTPHPGTRVFTAWDEGRQDKPPTSAQYYQDNTNQVFVTPPDSPVLGRKASRNQKKRASPSRSRRQKHRQEQTGDAVYVNDKQGVALYEEDIIHNAHEARKRMSTPDYEDWVQEAENKFAIQQKKYYEEACAKAPRKSHNYALDSRNPTHDYISWTACTNDLCRVHFGDKSGAGWFPSPEGACRWAAYDCTRHTCKDHLWDKRTSEYFPGINNTQAYANKAPVNKRCTNNTWHVCLNPECTRHAEDKYLHGFDNTPERCIHKKWRKCLDPKCEIHMEEKYFHGFTEKDYENKSFLEISNLQAATRSTQPLSTNSQ
jgi:hypothetical protein